MRHLRSSLRSSLAALAATEARGVITAAFLVDFAFVFVFVVALQSFFTAQYFHGRYLPALALAAYAAGKLLFQAPGGRLVDRLGWRLAAICALAGVLATQSLMLFAADMPAVLLPVAIAYGATGAVFWPAMYAAAAHGVSAASHSAVASALTLATGASAAGALAVGFVLPGSFPFWGALLIASIAVSGGLVIFIHGPRAGRDAGEGIGRGPGWVVSGPRLACFAIIFFQSAGIAALVAVFRAFGREVLGVSLRGEIGGLAPAACALGCGVGLAGFARARHRGALLTLAFAMAGASLLTAGEVTEPGRALLLAILAGSGLGLAIPTTTALLLDAGGGERSGSVFGVALTFEGLGQVAGPLLAGIPGNPGVALQVAGGLLLAAAFTAAYLLLAYRPAVGHAATAENEIALAVEGL